MFGKSIEVFIGLTFPIYVMYLSASYIPATVINLVRAQQFSVLFSASKFKEAWFARFWAWFGIEARKMVIPNAGPLIVQARGVVLDIGPGSGEWIGSYDKEKVEKIYGVEPNKDHHELLRRRVKEAGLSDIYVIVPVGVEDLNEGWVGRGEVDTIITLQCLCSLEKPREMIKALYRYLREGGEWIVYEHVVTHQGGMTAAYQGFLNIFWPHFLGGCSLTRDTEKWLRASGSWSKIDLKQPDDEPSYKVLPHIMGVLTR